LHFFQFPLVVNALVSIVLAFSALAHGVLDDVALEEATELFWRQDGLHDVPWLYGHVFVVGAADLALVGVRFGYAGV
jgi:hypothetical protein